MKKYVPRWGWICVFLSLVLYPLSGETVMVSLKGTNRTVLSAIEGGVMEVLFDAGFIVFNGAFHNNSGLYPPLSDYQAAREGGATLLIALEVMVAQKSPKDPIVPVSLHYWLLRVADRKILVQGTIEAGELPKKDQEAWEQYADRWGKEAALRVVKGYQ